MADFEFLAGIDPGPEHSGFVYIGISTFSPTVRSSVIVNYGHVSNDQLLDQLSSDYLDCIIIEGIANYGRQQGNDTIRTGYMVGRLIDRWKTSGHTSDRLGIFLTPEVRAGVLGQAKGTTAVMIRAKVRELWAPILPTALLAKSCTHELMALSLLTHYIQNVHGKEFFKS